MPKAPEPPRFLYKYCSPERIDVIEKGRIRFTQPTLLNDPFEMRPVIPEFTGHEIEKIYEDELAFQAAQAGKPIHIFRPLFQAKFPQKKLANNLQAFRREGDRMMQNAMAVRWGLLCLSANKDSLPMWAHYAAEHKGFVIEFDTSHGMFLEYRRVNALTRVAYVENRPTTHYGDCAEPLVYSKSHQWRHEAEWRVLGDFRKFDPPVKKDKQEIYTASFAMGAVTSIYLGVQSELILERQMKKALLEDGRRHIKMHRARIPRDRFGLDFALVSI